MKRALPFQQGGQCHDIPAVRDHDMMLLRIQQQVFDEGEESFEKLAIRFAAGGIVLIRMREEVGEHWQRRVHRLVRLRGQMPRPEGGFDMQRRLRGVRNGVTSLFRTPRITRMHLMHRHAAEKLRQTRQRFLTAFRDRVIRAGPDPFHRRRVLIGRRMADKEDAHWTNSTVALHRRKLKLALAAPCCTLIDKV